MQTPGDGPCEMCAPVTLPAANTLSEKLFNLQEFSPLPILVPCVYIHAYTYEIIIWIKIVEKV